MPKPAIDASALARAYAAARYAAVLDGLEMPFAVGFPADALERAWPMARYGFLTAWNPASEPRPDAENIAADTRLVECLDAAAIPHRPARATDASGRWREPGWLLGGVGAPRLFMLGREFGQAGVLVWRRGGPVRLAMLLSRGHSGAEPAFTDWVE